MSASDAAFGSVLVSASDVMYGSELADVLDAQFWSMWEWLMVEAYG